MKNQFIIEFTYYEKGKIRTTYAGYILSLPSPFRSFDQAKRFKTIDDARGWLTDILKDNQKSHNHYGREVGTGRQRFERSYLC